MRRFRERRCLSLSCGTAFASSRKYRWRIFARSCRAEIARLPPALPALTPAARYPVAISEALQADERRVRGRLSRTQP